MPKKNVIPDYNDLPEGKSYGGHSYIDPTKSKKVFCKFGCGCWFSGDSEGGPVGLNPLKGECPGNPLDGKKLGGNLDWATVVVRRIYRFLSMQKAIRNAGHSLRTLLRSTEDE